MTKAMDSLDKIVKKHSQNGHKTYGCCKRCGKKHEGGMAIRFQTTTYSTTHHNGHGQKIIWSRSRAVCRDCAAEGIERALKFLGEDK